MTYEKAHNLLLSLEAAEQGMKHIAGEKGIHQVQNRAGGTGPAGPAKTGPLFPHILSGNGR